MSQGDIQDRLAALGKRCEPGGRAFFSRVAGGGPALVAVGVIAARGVATTASVASGPHLSKAEAGDLKILNLALTAECPAVDAYTRATATGIFSSAVQTTLQIFR
ncbi:MAG TPA: hypothetical protein VIA06_06140 [Candidatus Dormibacteraeota bacterium]|jgi:hypothetical protein|nr:hypothetical protein [Candidatus Dormibacteraeota bacterium]